MEWKDIKIETPTLEDCGKEYFVAIKLSTRHEYQVAEWFTPIINPYEIEEEDDKPYFNIQHSWCGQQMLNKEVTHWCEIPDIPDNN